jgi:hypothetical protein
VSDSGSKFYFQNISLSLKHPTSIKHQKLTKGKGKGKDKGKGKVKGIVHPITSTMAQRGLEV